MKFINESKKLWNLFLGYVAYNLKITKSINHPMTYVLETTNVCNLDCIMCPRRIMKRKIGYIDFKLFKKIIDETSKYTHFVLLHHFGEPLLDKNMIKYIKYCRKKGVNTGFSTNATALTKKKSIELFNSGIHEIMFCIDGFTKETYEKVRNKGDYETVKNNILTFLELKKQLKKKKPHTTLQIIRMKETEKEIKDFIKFWEKTGIDDIYIKEFCTWADQEKTIKNLSEQKHRYHKKKLKKRPPCYYLWHSLIIYWDGTVVACCRDFDKKIVLGNVKNQTLEEIWKSKKMEKLREMHIKGNFNLPLCNKCDDYPYVYPSPFLFPKRNIKKVLQQIRKYHSNRKKRFSYLRD